ncbi:MAG: acylneuraminate cytidylyltransferase family protein [Promethearchaeota archaeon]
MSGRGAKFLGLVPARGGSKRIPRKNVKLLAGKPLVAHTLDAARRSKLLDRTVVSTEDEAVAAVCRSLGAEVPFMRPAKLATDEASSVDVVVHALKFLEETEGYRPDYVVLLQPTSPLRTSDDVDAAIELVMADPAADSLVSVVEVPHNFHPDKIMRLEGRYLRGLAGSNRIVDRHQLDRVYARNGAAIYISRAKLVLEGRRLLGERVVPYFMPRERSVDLDDEFDWAVAECLFKRRTLNAKN